MRPISACRFALIALAGVVFIGIAPAAQAQPSIPATFYGTVTRGGEPVPGGTPVRAFVDGNDCTQDGANYRETVDVDGVAQYSIEVVHESQEPGCGAEGREVTFTVGGEPAAEAAPWSPGPQRLDLTVEGQSPTALPSPASTATPLPSEVPSATQTSATVERPTGTPPRDDVDLDEVFGSANEQEPPAQPGAPASGSADESSLLPWLIAGGAGVLALGSVLGWYLARRKIPPAHRS